MVVNIRTSILYALSIYYLIGHHEKNCWDDEKFVFIIIIIIIFVSMKSLVFDSYYQESD